MIVGGGAGGLELATRLGNALGKRRDIEVLLVDPALTHLWKPLLHEVAAGTLDSQADAISFLAQARYHGFGFRLGRMEGLDRKAKTVHLAATIDEHGIKLMPARELAYDTLVISVGSTVDDFGVTGVKEHCIFLDCQEQAERFHKAFLAHHLKAQASGTNAEAALDIGIVGAGATGVELAAELHAASRQLVTYGLDHFAANGTVGIAVIEAAERVLPGLPVRLSQATDARLRELGVRVHVGEQVSEVTADGVHTKNGLYVPCRMKVWAAGIRAPDFLGSLDDLETNRRNQLVVRPTLQSTKDDDIFAFGDCAACPWPGHDRPVPPRAQAAHQQATLLARSLLRHLEGKPLADFKYKDRGSLISLSRYAAVGTLMGRLLGEVSFEGWMARLAYRSLYRMHQRALFGPLRTALIMAADWLRRGARPVLKLH